MTVQTRSTQQPWYSYLKPCPGDDRYLIDPDSVHIEDSQPIAYIKDRLDHATLRREAFDTSPFGFSVTTGVLSAGAGVVANAALGPLGGAVVGGVVGGAVNAWLQEGIAECRQDRAQAIRHGAGFGAVAGAIAGCAGPWGLAAGAVLGALSTPL